MNKIRKILAVVVIFAGPFLAMPVSADGNCAVTVMGSTNDANTASSRLQINGNVATATVVVTGDNCTQAVTMSSWNAPNDNFTGENVAAQTMSSFNTQNFAPGTHTISTNMPNGCFFQVDVLRVSEPSVNGTAFFNPNDLMGWAQGKNTSNPACVPQPAPTPPPAQPTVTPAPTPPPPAPVTPAVTITAAPVSAPAPTVLPNTGPGSILGIAGLVSIAGALAHRYFLRRHLT